MGLIHSECARIDPLETLSDARSFDRHANDIQEIATVRTGRAATHLGQIARTTARSNGLRSVRREIEFESTLVLSEKSAERLNHHDHHKSPQIAVDPITTIDNYPPSAHFFSRLEISLVVAHL